MKAPTKFIELAEALGALYPSSDVRIVKYKRPLPSLAIVVTIVPDSSMMLYYEDDGWWRALHLLGDLTGRIRRASTTYVQRTMVSYDEDGDASIWAAEAIVEAINEQIRRLYALTGTPEPFFLQPLRSLQKEFEDVANALTSYPEED